MEFGYENVKYLIEKAAEIIIFVRIDMETHLTQLKHSTLYRRYRAEGFDNVGVVIQAYMRRSIDDVKSLLSYKPSIRLCKGIYKEAPEIAYQGKEEVRTNYKKLFDLMIENGVYVGIATHDDPLIDYAANYIKQHNVPRDNYEFQMLLGVRENKRNEIIKNGHRLRVYTPFGEDWYGYSTRRLQENPDMAGQIFKAIFIKS